MHHGFPLIRPERSMSDRWFLFWKVVFWVVIYALLAASLLMFGYGAYLIIRR
jgi:hypothetical protein